MVWVSDDPNDPLADLHAALEDPHGAGLFELRDAVEKVSSPEETAHWELLKRRECVVPPPTADIATHLGASRSPFRVWSRPADAAESAEAADAAEAADRKRMVDVLAAVMCASVRKSPQFGRGRGHPMPMGGEMLAGVRRVAHLLVACPLMLGNRPAAVRARHGGLIIAGGMAARAAVEGGEAAGGDLAESDLDVFVVAPTHSAMIELVKAFNAYMTSTVAPALLVRAGGVSNATAKSVNASCKPRRTVHTEEYAVVAPFVLGERAGTVGVLNIQVVVRREFPSALAVLRDFDIGPCMAAHDGRRLLAALPFARAIVHGVEVLYPGMDRGGRYGRRLIKHLDRYGLGLVAPGWEPGVMPLVKAHLHACMSVTRLAALATSFRGAASFALAYAFFEVFGKLLQPPTAQAAGKAGKADAAEAAEAADAADAAEEADAYGYARAAGPAAGGRDWVDAAAIADLLELLAQRERFMDAM